MEPVLVASPHHATHHPHHGSPQQPPAVISSNRERALTMPTGEAANSFARSGVLSFLMMMERRVGSGILVSQGSALVDSGKNHAGGSDPAIEQEAA